MRAIQSLERFTEVIENVVRIRDLVIDVGCVHEAPCIVDAHARQTQPKWATKIGCPHLNELQDVRCLGHPFNVTAVEMVVAWQLFHE